MFPYTEKYTESESDIQKNDLLYKVHQQCQNTFKLLECLQTIETIKTNHFKSLFYYIYNFNNYTVLVLYINTVYHFWYVYYIVRTPLRTPLRTPSARAPSLCANTFYEDLYEHSYDGVFVKVSIKRCSHYKIHICYIKYIVYMYIYIYIHIYIYKYIYIYGYI